MKARLELAVDVVIAMINTRNLKLPKKKGTAAKFVSTMITEVHRELMKLPKEKR